MGLPSRRNLTSANAPRPRLRHRRRRRSQTLPPFVAASSIRSNLGLPHPSAFHLASAFRLAATSIVSLGSVPISKSPPNRRARPIGSPPPRHVVARHRTRSPPPPSAQTDAVPTTRPAPRSYAPAKTDRRSTTIVVVVVAKMDGRHHLHPLTVVGNRLSSQSPTTRHHLLQAPAAGSPRVFGITSNLIPRVFGISVAEFSCP
jgi:hypothetical protein